MNSSLRKEIWGRPRWAFAVSVAAGLLSILIATILHLTTPGDVHEKVYLDIIVIYAGLIFAAGADLAVRLAQQEEKADTHRNILDGMDRTPRHYAEFSDLIRLTGDADASDAPEFIKTRIGEVLRRACDDMGALATGRFRTDKWAAVLLDQYSRARPEDRILAVTEPRDTNWWLSERSIEYLQANKDACKRGALIQRVFILGDAPALNDQLLPIMQRNQEAGVVVRVVTPERSKTMPPRLKISVTCFVDGGLLQREITNTAGQTVEYQYCVGKDDLHRAKNEFDELMSWAIDLESWLAMVHPRAPDH